MPILFKRTAYLHVIIIIFFVSKANLKANVSGLIFAQGCCTTSFAVRNIYQSGLNATFQRAVSDVRNVFKMCKN